MKKFLALLLALMMVLSLCACGGIDAETAAKLDEIEATVANIEAALGGEAAPAEEAAPAPVAEPAEETVPADTEAPAPEAE